jgi:hypothetical protein
MLRAKRPPRRPRFFPFSDNDELNRDVQRQMI